MFRFIWRTKGPWDVNACIGRAFKHEPTRCTRAKRTDDRSSSAHFRHPHARRGIHLSEECEARVRDISSTASASIPLLRPCSEFHRAPVALMPIWMPISDTGAIAEIRDDTAGTNDALSWIKARIWQTYARGALSGFTCMDLTGMSFSVTSYFSLIRSVPQSIELRKIYGIIIIIASINNENMFLLYKILSQSDSYLGVSVCV